MQGTAKQFHVVWFLPVRTELADGEGRCIQTMTDWIAMLAVARGGRSRGIHQLHASIPQGQTRKMNLVSTKYQYQVFQIKQGRQNVKGKRNCCRKEHPKVEGNQGHIWEVVTEGRGLGSRRITWLGPRLPIRPWPNMWNKFPNKGHWRAEDKDWI